MTTITTQESKRYSFVRLRNFNLHSLNPCLPLSLCLSHTHTNNTNGKSVGGALMSDVTRGHRVTIWPLDGCFMSVSFGERSNFLTGEV